MAKGNHNPLLIALMVITAVFFIVLMVLNYFAGNPGSSGGLFIRGITNVSNTYNLEITPAGWTFSIWGFIYTWQALWIIYSFVNICRSTPEGPVYTSPVLLPTGYFVIYILNLGLNGSWLFLWDREYLSVSAVFLLLTAVTLYIDIGISYNRLYKNEAYLVEHVRRKEIYLVHFLVQNGLAMYAAWCTIATLLNFGAVLVYIIASPLSNQDGSTVCLAILSAEIVVYVIADLSVLDRYSRYVFMPYIVLIVALAGSMSKNWDPVKTNSIFTAVLMGVAGVCLVLKFVFMFIRRNRKMGIMV